MRAAQRLSAALVSRTGLGVDVHRFAEGEELWLGGLLIPHDKGLSGHSDADVVLHALTDALLGAIGEGDIGDHFPPSDPQWRGAPRSEEHTSELQSLMRISYAVFCLKKNKQQTHKNAYSTLITHMKPHT